MTDDWDLLIDARRVAAPSKREPDSPGSDFKITPAITHDAHGSHGAKAEGSRLSGLRTK